MDFLSKLLGKSPGKDIVLGSSLPRENTSGDPSQNIKPNDIAKNLTTSQISTTSKSSHTKASDESSDSSLDYDSANEGSSPRDDSASDAFTNKLKTPQTVRENQDILESPKPITTPFYDINNSPSNVNFNEEIKNQQLSHKKKKVYNELTESFETPNSSTLCVENTSIAIPINDTYEIGEDPLSFVDDISFKLSYEPDSHQEDVQNHLKKISESNETLNTDDKDNETRSYCSNDRESSVEVIKEDPNVNLDSTYPAGNANLNATDINNSFIKAFNKLSVSPKYYEETQRATNLDHKQELVRNNCEELTFDETQINLINKVRRDSGASVLVISSTSGIEVPSEIVQNITSPINKSEVEISHDVLNSQINSLIAETNVEYNKSGCENIIENGSQNNIETNLNAENSTPTIVDEITQSTNHIEKEQYAVENSQNVSIILENQNTINDTISNSIDELKCSNLEKSNEISPDICEATNLHVITNQNVSVTNSSFCEPMDCDDSYTVNIDNKLSTENTTTENESVPVPDIVESDIHQKNEIVNDDKCHVVNAVIECTSIETTQETVTSSNKSVSDVNIEKIEISEQTEPAIENISVEEKPKTLDFIIESESIQVTEKESNNLQTSNVEQNIPIPISAEQCISDSIHPESIPIPANTEINVEKECLAVISETINTESIPIAANTEINVEKECSAVISETINTESIPIAANTEINVEKECSAVISETINTEKLQQSFDDSLISKLTKSLSSDSLEAFNIEEQKCEITNTTISKNDLSFEKKNTDLENSNISKVAPNEILGSPKQDSKPNNTNIDDIPIKCKVINYAEIDFDSINPFATSSKVRNSVEKEQVEINPKEQIRTVTEILTSHEKPKVSTDKIVPKQKSKSPTKSPIKEKLESKKIEKVTAEKSIVAEMENPFVTKSRVSNSPERNLSCKPDDIKNENANIEIKSNGNIETLSDEIALTDTSCENNNTANKNLTDVREESVFKSPIAPLQNKKIDQVSKMVSKANLSPMSRCGDLMGLSPVANVKPKDDTECQLSDEISNDLLTGRELLSDCNDMDDDMMMDVDDEEFKNQLFEDPAAFDFLLKCGNNSKASRDFGKESLFVKFDPLVKLPTGVRPGRETAAPSKTDIPIYSPKIDDDASTASGLAESCSSDSSVSAINSEQGKTLSTMSSVEQGIGVLSLQTQSSQPLIASVPAIPQAVNSNVSNLQTVDKPTQIVSPAKSLRPQYQPCTPPSSQSLSKNNLPVSPAIAAIDRLINLGLNTPPPPPPVIQPKQEPEMNPQLLNELQSVRGLLSNQEQELQQANEQINNLKQQLAESSEREQTLIERVNEKSRNNRQMSVVMEEYERTMAQIIGERDAEKRQWLEERAALVRDRDETSSHLASIEHSFNDIHAKYERCKSVIQTYKNNEELLKQNVARYEENIKKQVERYEQLRQHAMSQLDKASQEIDAVKKSSQAEIIKLQAMLKKSDISISSLQESLAQKTKNCEELTSICDELINKVG